MQHLLADDDDDEYVGLGLSPTTYVGEPPTADETRYTVNALDVSAAEVAYSRGGGTTTNTTASAKSCCPTPAATAYPTTSSPTTP